MALWLYCFFFQPMKRTQLPMNDQYHPIMALFIFTLGKHLTFIDKMPYRFISVVIFPASLFTNDGNFTIRKDLIPRLTTLLFLSLTILSSNLHRGDYCPCKHVSFHSLIQSIFSCSVVPWLVLPLINCYDHYCYYTASVRKKQLLDTLVSENRGGKIACDRMLDYSVYHGDTLDR